jgi:hypothetical protein
MKLVVPILLFFSISFKPPDKYVYICKSPKAYAYHSTTTCRGMRQCTHEIIKVTLNDAINNYGKKKACGYCYKK